MAIQKEANASKFSIDHGYFLKRNKLLECISGSHQMWNTFRVAEE